MKIRGWALVPRSTVNKRLWTLEKKFCKRIYHCVIVRKINDRMCGLNLKWSCWHFRARVLSPGCIRFWSSLKFTVTKKVTVSWGACAVEFIETDLLKDRIPWIFSVQTLYAKCMYFLSICKCIHIAFWCIQKWRWEKPGAPSLSTRTSQLLADFVNYYWLTSVDY